MAPFFSSAPLLLKPVPRVPGVSTLEEQEDISSFPPETKGQPNELEVSRELSLKGSPKEELILDSVLK